MPRPIGIVPAAGAGPLDRQLIPADAYIFPARLKPAGGAVLKRPARPGRPGPRRAPARGR